MPGAPVEFGGIVIGWVNQVGLVSGYVAAELWLHRDELEKLDLRIPDTDPASLTDRFSPLGLRAQMVPSTAESEGHIRLLFVDESKFPEATLPFEVFWSRIPTVPSGG